MNNFIAFPNLDIDLEKLVQAVRKQIDRPVPGLPSHQRKVECDPYIQEIFDKYQFMSDRFNIDVSPPGYVGPLHIDSERKCAINFPINYTDDSHVVFYNLPEDPQIEYNEHRIFNEVDESNAVEIFRFTLEKPTLLNVTVPHKVFGGPKAYRVIMSWSFRDTYGFNDAKNLLGIS